MNDLNKYPRDSTVRIKFEYDCGFGIGYGHDLDISMAGGEVVIATEDDF